MKKLTKIATLALTLTIGTTSLFAYSDDYALTDNYKLLNDMKLSQKQQVLIVNMSQKIEKDNIDIKALKSYRNRFNRVLLGLINGDKSLNIKGTKLPKFIAKLNELQILWKKESTLLDNELKDRDTKETAIAGLNHIMLKSSEIVELYNISYSRFKQKSKISSIINRHINSSKNQIFAFNIRAKRR